MIVGLLLFLTFAVTIMTGPAGVEWAERRRAELDAPLVKVIYLPTASCRECSCDGDIAWLCDWCVLRDQQKQSTRVDAVDVMDV